MGFTVNTEEVYENNGGLMPEGDYEVVIKEVKEGKANSGTANIQVTLVVRNDVEQAYKNKNVWYTIWASKETGNYNAKAINTLSKSVGIPNGKSFSSVEEWGHFLEGKAVVASIKHDTYNDKTRERVSFISATKQSALNHIWKDKPATVPQQVEEDLPF